MASLPKSTRIRRRVAPLVVWSLLCGCTQQVDDVAPHGPPQTVQPSPPEHGGDGSGGELDGGPDSEGSVGSGEDGGLGDAGADSSGTLTDGGTPEGPAPELTLTFSPSPVANLPNVKFTQSVKYGADPAQVLDAFLPTSPLPTPAVFFFHGGGFTGGSRTSAYSGTAAALRRVLGDGAAFISVDYRLLKAAGTETEGVRKSLWDCMRAVQFVRRWARVFNIQPDRVGIYGSSAGAGASLWMAFHPDMAAPQSDDEVARQSTRVTAAAALSTQATYDILRWSPDVFGPTYPYMTSSFFFALPDAREMTVRFYGLKGSLTSSATALQAELQTAPVVAYRKDVDMLALLTADDPPTFVQNNEANKAPYDTDFDVLHHPLHAKALDERAAAVGADLLADIPAFNQDSSQTAMNFLLGKLLP